MENNKGEEEALELGGLLPKKFVVERFTVKELFFGKGNFIEASFVTKNV
jgi:hypothetical protein